MRPKDWSLFIGLLVLAMLIRDPGWNNAAAVAANFCAGLLFGWRMAIGSGNEATSERRDQTVQRSRCGLPIGLGYRCPLDKGHTGTCPPG